MKLVFIFFTIIFSPETSIYYHSLPPLSELGSIHSLSSLKTPIKKRKLLRHSGPFHEPPTAAIGVVYGCIVTHEIPTQKYTACCFTHWLTCWYVTFIGYFLALFTHILKRLHSHTNLAEKRNLTTVHVIYMLLSKVQTSRKTLNLSFTSLHLPFLLSSPPPLPAGDWRSGAGRDPLLALFPGFAGGLLRSHGEASEGSSRGASGNRLAAPSAGHVARHHGHAM